MAQNLAVNHLPLEALPAVQTWTANCKRDRKTVVTWHPQVCRLPLTMKNLMLNVSPPPPSTPGSILEPVNILQWVYSHHHHHNSSRQLAHKASTLSDQHSLFRAIALATSQPFHPALFRSFSTTDDCLSLGGCITAKCNNNAKCNTNRKCNTH